MVNTLCIIVFIGSHNTGAHTMNINDTFTHNIRGAQRQFTITMIQGAEYAHMFAHFQARGFDGQMYTATSQPTGRQRKVFNMMFLRNAKTGEMVPAL